MFPNNNGAVPKPTATSQPAATDNPLAPPSPPTLTEQVSAAITGQLTKLAAVNGKPTRDEMKAAMVAAGVVLDNVEVSIDKTPTGLAVDAIEAATKTDKDCVIGQVRDGQVAVTVLPVLPSGRCFVGDQH
ncbi:DUF6993 domain-containing protein [Arthrobacter sp. 35W]|uniref:DUF6993 domain-containing protein n=1 Tax=Arthrobacter sp. 35W TaxID=1132441 RepID=UPI0004269D73|nr:hypothetical protein [Arthrobacter sp. 35W]